MIVLASERFNNLKLSPANETLAENRYDTTIFRSIDSSLVSTNIVGAYTFLRFILYIYIYTIYYNEYCVIYYHFMFFIIHSYHRPIRKMI